MNPLRIMRDKFKQFLKKVLARLGFLHPSMGIKISAEAKATIILEHKGSLQTFIETGTYKGDMVEKMRNNFGKIYSIELDSELYRQAKKRFAGESYIRIIHGDSALELKKILLETEEPALFWLDAHAGGAITAFNSPIVAELDAIFSHSVRGHVILVDDARHFDRKTIRMIRKMARSQNYTFAIEDGIFRLAPNRLP